MHLVADGLDDSLKRSDVTAHWGSYVCLVITCYVLATVVRNVCFHPLSHFPGPFLARATLLWRIYNSTTGRFHRAIEAQHQIYGDIVRVSPNELSFASVRSWKDIYGPWHGQRPFIKSEFYNVFGGGFKSRCIGSEREPEAHRRMKAALASAFSTKALSEQENLVQGCVDNFVQRIGDVSRIEKRLDMTRWFELIAFDVLGEMAFGESFSSVEAGKPHPWQRLITEHVFFITLVDNFRRYPGLYRIGSWIISPLISRAREKHVHFSRHQVSKRLCNRSSRIDFLSRIIAKVEAGEVSKEELTAHLSTIVIAGGETVATTLAAATFYLCKYPSTLRKLSEEIRGRFRSYSAIDTVSAQELPYLRAVINETLRIFPPGSQGFPRISPGAFVDGIWIPGGTEIYTSAWTITHKESNFEDPNEFKPERWMDPSSDDIKEASQPFSLGPRGCIGRNFAYMEMVSLLAKVHWCYDIQLIDEELDWEGASSLHVMWWKPALMVRLKPRNENWDM